MHQGSLESAATNPSNVGNSTFTSTANSGTFTPGANDNSTAITNTEFLEMCDANNESAPSVASGSSQSQNASTPQPQAESNDAKSPSELSEADTSGTDESGSDTEYFPPLAGATLSEVRAEKYLIEDRIERLYRKSSEYEVSYAIS